MVNDAGCENTASSFCIHLHTDVRTNERTNNFREKISRKNAQCSTLSKEVDKSLFISNKTYLFHRISYNSLYSLFYENSTNSFHRIKYRIEIKIKEFGSAIIS